MRSDTAPEKVPHWSLTSLIMKIPLYVSLKSVFALVCNLNVASSREAPVATTQPVTCPPLAGVRGGRCVKLSKHSQRFIPSERCAVNVSH